MASRSFMGNRMGARLAGFALAVLCAASCAGCTAPSGEADDFAGVAAMFGEQRISEDEVTEYTLRFRENNGLEGDDEWASYLEGRAMSVETWREEAIRGLVDRVLIEGKAAEYGLSVDEDMVERRIAAMKDGAGIDPDDEQAWEDYLASTGQTAESLQDTLEFSSIEQQVFSHDIDFSGETRDELCNEYIRANLADQIVHRYSAIEFGLDDEPGALACVEELASVSGDDLAHRFGELAGDHGLSAEQADIGWDFLYDEWAIDPDLELRRAQLPPGELLDTPLKGEDAYRVVLCTERAEFAVIDYASLESENLKDVISTLARASGWTTLGANYLSDLEAAANVQVAPMPEGLPYDVELKGFGADDVG